VARYEVFRADSGYVVRNAETRAWVDGVFDPTPNGRERAQGSADAWNRDVPRLGGPGIGVGTLGALRETAGFHTDDPDSALGCFAEGTDYDPRAAYQEAAAAQDKAAAEDAPRLRELALYLHGQCLAAYARDKADPNVARGGRVVPLCPECCSEEVAEVAGTWKCGNCGAEDFQPIRSLEGDPGEFAQGDLVRRASRVVESYRAGENVGDAVEALGDLLDGIHADENGWVETDPA
jgi:hypothetical protein